MTGEHFSGRPTTCRTATSPRAVAVPSHVASTATPTSHSAVYSLGRVIGSVLLVPRLNASLRERGARNRRRSDRRADRSAKTSVGYLSDTQFGEFRGRASQGTGQIIFDSQRPARVQVSVSVNSHELRPDNAARDMDAKPPKVRRFPPVTLVARELRLPSEVEGAGDAGVLAGKLEFHGVNRSVNIPIVFTIDGTLLQGQGRFSIDLTDFGMKPSRLRGLEIGDDITIEIHLLAASDQPWRFGSPAAALRQGAHPPA